MSNSIYLVSSVFGFNRSSHTSQYFRKISLFVVALLFSFSAESGVFTFDLRGNDAALALDGGELGQLSSNGLTASFIAGPGALNRQIFNQTSTRFGINSLGTSNDSSSLIDAAAGTSEKLAISFNKLVRLDQLILSVFAPGEIAGLSIADASPVLLGGLADARDVYNFSGLTLAAGEKIILSHVSGNGFSFDSFSVSSVQVPEPPVVMLMSIGVISLLAFRRRKIQ